MTRKFLRFFGTLWEDGSFETGMGWETARLARRSLSDPDHRLELVDEAGNVLATGAVELRVSRCRHDEAQGVEKARVVGHVALHPDGRAVLLRRGERVLHRAEISVASPKIGAVDVAVAADGHLHVRWNAEHERPLVFNLVLIDGRNRRVPIGHDIAERELRVDTTCLPGGVACTIAVLATDGTRSTQARSAPFELTDKSPQVVLLAPGDGDTLPPDQPFTLLGVAQDLTGSALADEHLTWSVDGIVVARGRRCAVAGPLEPGPHRIELACLRGEQVVACAVSRVEVPARSPDQAQWLDMTHRLAAAERIG